MKRSFQEQRPYYFFEWMELLKPLQNKDNQVVYCFGVLAVLLVRY